MAEPLLKYTKDFAVVLKKYTIIVFAIIWLKYIVI